jgi:2-dehydropantoate 2-reductase
MKICLYGAGAMGGYIAALLMRAGQTDVTCIARGPHLAALQQGGLRLRIDGEEFTTRPFCTDDPAAAGLQDYVIVTLKAHALPGIAGRLPPLLGPDTAVVTACNGIPWWYFHGLDPAAGGPHLDTVDPGGALWHAIGPERAIGCALWPWASRRTGAAIA